MQGGQGTGREAQQSRTGLLDERGTGMRDDFGNATIDRCYCGGREKRGEKFTIFKTKGYLRTVVCCAIIVRPSSSCLTQVQDCDSKRINLFKIFKIFVSYSEFHTCFTTDKLWNCDYRCRLAARYIARITLGLTSRPRYTITLRVQSPACVVHATRVQRISVKRVSNTVSCLVSKSTTLQKDCRPNLTPKND